MLSPCLFLRADPDTDERTHWAVAVVNFMNYEGWEWSKIAAGGSLVMAPVLIFSLAVRRYLVSGLTAGAVKGEPYNLRPAHRGLVFILDPDVSDHVF